MNDTDMERWLAERFRAAPNPEPPERLRQAIYADWIRASVSRGSTGRSLAGGLRARRSLFAGLIGLAATAVLAVGLLMIVASRPTQTPAGPVRGIHWQPVTKVADVRLDFGPFLATAGGRLFMIGQEATVTPNGASVPSSYQTTIVWSSTDGVAWNQVSEPGSFEASGSTFTPLGLSDDGSGGLIVVGNTSVGNDLQEAMAWRSTDGRTWTQEQIGSSGPREIIGVAARPGAVVAFGHELGGSLVACFSADGGTWGQIVLPDSTGYRPRAITTWRGGFAAVAVYVGVATAATTAVVSSVWTSVDGRTWEKAQTQLTGFDATAMAALDNSVVAVGSRSDDRGLSAASWRSTDGRTWAESTAPATQPATAFSDVTAVNDALVAIGVRSNASVASTPRPGSTTPPVVPTSVWISTDGSTWSLLPADPSLVIDDWLHTHIASLGGRVVVATRLDSVVGIFVGNVIRGGASAAPPTGMRTAPTGTEPAAP